MTIMPIMLEPSLVDQVNDLGWQLKRLQEFKRLLELEIPNEDNKVAYWRRKIEEFCRKLRYTEDNASQFLWRCNRRKGVFGLIKSFFTFLLCRFQLPNLRLSISEVQKEMEKLETEMEEWSEKWVPLPMSRREQHVENGTLNEVVVGREEDIRSLLKFLEEDNVDYPFFAVCGKGGLGKTTLVRKVYNTPDVRHNFMGCAWITAPHQVQAKTLWQDIISQIEPGRKDEMKKLSDSALAQRLHSSLQSGRYLIVLDDVRSTEASLIALPTVGIRSRVVITTRETYQAEKIVERNQRIGHILKMSPLTEAQSWELFLQKQLPSHRSEFEKNPELKEICGDVVEKCNGVPLEIMVLGDLMAEKHSIDEWKLLHKKFTNSAKDTLELSYNLLPWNLKSCLLYLAVFPKDTDTEAEKLYNLWIAEGLITTTVHQEDGNSSTMLSTAETYLKQLAAVGLVQVQEEETPMLTKIKSCRLHDLVRELCCQKAEKESLFAAVDLRRAGNSSQDTRLTTDVRTLAFYFDKRVGGYDFPNPNKFRKLRSFLFLNAPHPHHHLVPDDEHLLLPKSLVLKNCRLLRVLDFNSLDFHGTKLPKDIHNLATLRYLSFRGCNLPELSPSIGRLPNLKILDLRVNPTVDMSISNVLYKITRLKNLYFPQKFHAVGGKLQLDGLSELENLNNFASTRCQCKDLPRLKNLKLLAATIEGNLDDLGETIKCIKGERFKSSSIVLKNFDCYSHKRLSALSNLLGCEHLNALRVEGHIGNLSCPISEKLTELFLLGSELTEDPMPVFGKIPQLQKLVVCNGAYLGDAMDCKAHTFLQLRYLKLSNLHILKDWTLEEGSMGKLSTLTVEKCQSLENLPEGLKFLIHLREVNIVNMPKMSTTLKREGQTEIQRFSGQYSDKIKHVLSINIL
ncbi:putative inactive disease susceptibility protein LOV1 [Ipomoea triloba]|uniref:putative inactive disease susceptibility protein LOV1 n=1 Tax=Ipomoea triloba TaxID=35885 RepID=UPI00125D84B9|nr:putative inactive disease susceptibility protein LOV1 [Ipomoea triloba]